MGFIKKLLNDSLVYGIGAAMTRAINYLLVPIHTYAFPSESGEYSVITRMYAYTAILMVFLVFGMETTYFYFAGKAHGEEDKRQIYSAILAFVGLVSLSFSILVVLFIEPIAEVMKYPDHHDYVLPLFICIAFDAFHTIPSAYLRQLGKKRKFLIISYIKTLLIVLLNFIYFQLLPTLNCYPFGLYGSNGEYDVSYVFYINLYVSIITTFFFWKELSVVTFKFDNRLLSAILKYSIPLVSLQIVGMIMQNADKVLYPYLDKTIQSGQNLSIYGGVAKITVVMLLLNSFFRFAFDPLALKNTNEVSNKDDLASAMKIYVIIMLMAFLGVSAIMNILRYIINTDYWPGLFVVPILMGAQILSGIYQNISMGYKQINKNKWLVFFAILTFLLFVVLNVAFVPLYGYKACAWAQLVSFGFAAVLSYGFGRRITKIDYPVLPLLRYVVLALILFFCMTIVNERINTIWAIFLNLPLVIIFVLYYIYKDRLNRKLFRL